MLDLSKVFMMDFHYNVVDKQHAGKYSVLYSDTDSIVYYFLNNDIYEWKKSNKQYF